MAATLVDPELRSSFLARRAVAATLVDPELRSSFLARRAVAEIPAPSGTL